MRVQFLLGIGIRRVQQGLAVERCWIRSVFPRLMRSARRWAGRSMTGS